MAYLSILDLWLYLASYETINLLVFSNTYIITSQTVFVVLTDMFLSFTACSAGVGRSGTFIALDYFAQFVEEHSLDDSIDVFDFVLQMRKNRTRMVQVEVNSHNVCIQYLLTCDVQLSI